MLAKDYDLNRAQVRKLITQYLGLEVPSGEFRIDMLLYSNLFLLLLLMFCEIELVWGIFVGLGENAESSSGVEDEALLSAFYRIERNLRHALKPVYEVLFERLNTHPGGLKFLTVLRADILSILA